MVSLGNPDDFDTALASSFLNIRVIKCRLTRRRISNDSAYVPLCSCPYLLILQCVPLTLNERKCIGPIQYWIAIILLCLKQEDKFHTCSWKTNKKAIIFAFSGRGDLWVFFRINSNTVRKLLLNLITLRKLLLFFDLLFTIFVETLTPLIRHKCRRDHKWM